MASFPHLARPCPLRFRALPEPGRDWCSFCEKRVHDLDRLSEPERAALLARGGDICVAYSVQRAASTALAAAAVSATLAAAPAEAQPPVPRAPAPEVEEFSVTHTPSDVSLRIGVAMTFSIDWESLGIRFEKLGREVAGRPADFSAAPQLPQPDAR